MVYTSVQNPKIKEARKLLEKKERDRKNLFLIEGKHLVEEAYKSGVLKEVFLLEGETDTLGIPTSIVSKNVMKSLSSLESVPTIIGIALKKEEPSIGNHIVILEDVQDPGNIGTILRSAVAFRVDTVILTKGCADVYSPKVVRSSQGMLFHLSILQKEIEEVIPFLKENQIFVIGTKVNGGKPVKDIEKFSKFAIIMGNEGMGVKESTLSLCDTFAYIPMNENCESLNVGVAASILLYELGR